MPGTGATWQDFDGTYAIFDGVESPLTQTFGLGLFTGVTPPALSQIEAFFERRGAAVMHEVSPLAGVETFALLVDRGYRPLELSTVLVQGIEDPRDPPSSPGLRVRIIEPHDRGAWVETAVTGRSDDPAVAPIVRSIAEVSSANQAMANFLVERDGAPIATARWASTRVWRCSQAPARSRRRAGAGHRRCCSRRGSSRRGLEVVISR